MPRRPHTKNIPSRLFEDSRTPIYVVDQALTVVYANKAIADLLLLDRDEVVGQKLKYLADYRPEKPADYVQSLCPPPRFFNLQVDSTTSEATLAFGITLPEQNTFWVSCSNISGHEQDQQYLICSLTPSHGNTEQLPTTDWLHQKIQQFRLSQAKRFNAIPFLGTSSIAKKCFAQARAYALLESNVALIGHSGSQVLDLAKSVHYSGFANEGEPDPLLPVDCKQIEGARVQEILVGHFQVECGNDPDAKAYVLLINADSLDPVAQQDLLTICQLDEINVRIIATSQSPLSSVPGFNTELANQISTLELHLPALQNRIEDIPLLAQYIVEQECGGSRILGADLIQALQLYPWKNDFRELESVLVQAIGNGTSAEIRLSDCAHDFKMALKAMENPLPKVEPVDLDQLLAEIELETIQRAIQASKGNKTNAARMLGITRARLHRRLDEHKMDANQPEENGSKSDSDEEKGSS